MAGVLVAVATVLGACGSTAGSSVPATSTAGSGAPTGAGVTGATGAGSASRDSTSVLRRTYLAAVDPVAGEFLAFTDEIESSGGSAAQVIASAKRLAASVQNAANRLAALEPHAPPKVATDIAHVLRADNGVYQGLEDLVAGYGSRSFNFTAWGTNLAGYVAYADSSANTLRRDLGLPPESVPTTTTTNPYAN